MEISIKSASEMFKVSRTTIYEKLKSGDLSRYEGGGVETSELIRVFGNPTNRRTRKEEKERIEQVLKTQQNEHLTEPATNRLDTEKERLYMERINSLEEQLRQAHERELWSRQHADKLTDTIRLLEAPKKGFFKRLF